MAIYALLEKVFALLWLVTLATATPSEQDNTRRHYSHPKLREKRQASGSPIAVTGITNAGVQPRIDIRQMAQNADMINLYLVGLSRFMAVDQNDPLSYYQIAGIHGRPYAAWNGARAAPGVEWPGYCTHSSNLFGPWHRPYLALFEQTLFSHIIDFANEFPAGATRQRLGAVAMQWRLPYLDWAAVPSGGGSVLPPIMSQPTVSVNLPNGSTTIPNPLYSYKFHPAARQDFQYDPFASWGETKRAPAQWSSDVQSRNQQVAAALDNNRNSMMNRVYSLFTAYDNYTRFSNEAWYSSSDDQNADSLESLHDVVHANTGMNGHMTYLDYSAFDPIFWVHHAMLDRIAALWQSVHSDSYVEPAAAIVQTYTIRIGDREDVDSPLMPFRRDASGTFHTAATVRSTNDFGYTFAELAGNADQGSIKTAINRLYGSNAASGASAKRDVSSKREAADTGSSLNRKVSGAATRAMMRAAPGMIVGGQYQHYVANTVSEKFAVNGSYSIYFFLGDVASDPNSWPLAPNLVGTHAVFAGLPGVDAQASGLRAGSGMSIKVSASVPLTDGLLVKVSHGELSSMEPEVVAAYLQHNLHWRVAMMDGTEMPVKEDDLTIKIFSAKVQPAQSEDEFPVWSEYVELDYPDKQQPAG